MSFSNNQLRKLAGKLPERYVKTRSQRTPARSGASPVRRIPALPRLRPKPRPCTSSALCAAARHGQQSQRRMDGALCPLHHRSLHDAGVEEEWWHAKAIDAKAEAENLWRRRHSTPAVAGGVTVAIAPDSAAPAGGQRPNPDPANSPIKSPPTADHERPLPINLRADIPRSR